MSKADFGAELRNAMPEPSAMADQIMADAAAPAPRMGLNGTSSPELPPAPVVPVVAAGDTCEVIFIMAQGMLGPEWEPSPTERASCVRALERYYEKYGAFDLPPGWALVAAFGCYAIPRVKDKIGNIAGALMGGAAPENPADKPGVGGDGRAADAGPADPFGVPVQVVKDAA